MRSLWKRQWPDVRQFSGGLPLGGSTLTRLVRRPQFWSALIFVAVLSAWQWVPSIPNISKVMGFADPFFISSPERCAVELWHLMSGTDHTEEIWVPLLRTFGTAMVGTVAAIVVGCGGGLICSNWSLVNRTLRPFVVLFNAVPKVALIPIVILIVGSSAESDAIVAFMGVFMVVFFNAFEGGSSVKSELLQNARILGAGWAGIMFRIRGPFVMAWTFATIPNAVAFGLVGTVTAELFTGSSGIGQILIDAVDTANADLTFATVIVLGVLGVALVLGSDVLRKKLLFWW